VWEQHVEEFLREGQFNKMYRMSIHAFTYLCVLLDPFLYVDPIMSTLRTNQPIIGTEIIVSSFIRWASAGSFHDIRMVAGISTASFYRVMGKCARAIIDCDALAH
jgi:hypothetical protein